MKKKMVSVMFNVCFNNRNAILFTIGKNANK